ELDSRRRRSARLQFHVGAGAGLDSRGRAGDERDGLVRQPRAGRIPESGTLQQVAAHTRIAKRRKQVDVAFHSDFVVALRCGLHLGGGVVPGSEVNSLIRAWGRIRPTAAFTTAASSASAMTGSAPSSFNAGAESRDWVSANTSCWFALR